MLHLAEGALDGLPTATLPTIGVGGLLTLVVLMVLTGALVPGRTHRRELQAERERTAEANQRAERWEQVALRAMGQSDQLLSTTELTARVLPSMLGPPDPQPAPGGRS